MKNTDDFNPLEKTDNFNPWTPFFVLFMIIMFIRNQTQDQAKPFVEDCQTRLYSRALLKSQNPGSMDVFTMEEMVTALRRFEYPYSLDYEVYDPTNRKIMVARCTQTSDGKWTSFSVGEFREKK